VEVLHCAFAQASFEARHDSRDEDGGVAESPDETKNLLLRYMIIREHQDKEFVVLISSMQFLQINVI
jgi:hypothetical protein